MNIRDMQRAAWQNSEDHGFHQPNPNIPERLALIHSEVSEALEAYRDGQMQTKCRESDGKPEGFASELADIVIRVMDLAEELKIDLHQEIAVKHGFNMTHPHKHGGKAC